MKKVRTEADIRSDERIESFIRDYDGRGVHMIECKPEYHFTTNNSSCEIGNMKEICYEINERLEKKED